MNSHRVSMTRITLDYFEVDVKSNTQDEQVVIETAQDKIADEPGRHQLGESNVAIIVTSVRQI